jgi:hypothetical protein
VFAVCRNLEIILLVSFPVQKLQEVEGGALLGGLGEEGGKGKRSVPHICTFQGRCSLSGGRDWKRCRDLDRSTLDTLYVLECDAPWLFVTVDG